MKNKKVGSLFAGIGGICLAFIEAGFEMVWANELDSNAVKTYQNNFSHQIIEKDIRSLKIEKLEKVDIITSGFPCQPFSITGQRKGFTDLRGNLFFETAKVIDFLRPTAYLLENVKHLIKHNNGNTFNIIKNTITELGYSFIPFVLNSTTHGNIPQNRERIYIVGFIN
jgi:DNA (cytosine-5)-methyltransferase 1